MGEGMEEKRAGHKPWATLTHGAQKNEGDLVKAPDRRQPALGNQSEWETELGECEQSGGGRD